MIVTQKNHWAKEVIIKIAKSNTRCSEIPEFQPEQVECVLQITCSCNGKIWEIFALVLPCKIVVLPDCRAKVASMRTIAASASF